jgi:hypothetical protein
MKKLIVLLLAMSVSAITINPFPAQALMPTDEHVVAIQGSCTKAYIDGQDYTSLCGNTLYQGTFPDGEIINGIKVGEISVMFGGYHDVQSSLKRYTLYIQRVGMVNAKSELTSFRIVGTCEMYGEIAKTQATHICKTEGEVNILIEFKSNPKTLRNIR